MIRREDELVIGGVHAQHLVETYETPLYVYDAATIRDRYAAVETAFTDRYENTRLHYAVKANNNPSILDLLLEEGAGFDCGSPAEIWLAKQVGAEPEDILYTGAYNRADELAYAVEQGVTINLDAPYLLEKLQEVPERLSFRVNPGIGDGEFGLVFAGEDAKFGTAEERVVEAYRAAQENGVESFGIHMMTGSNIRDPTYFERITSKLLDIAGTVRAETDVPFEFVDIGGGLGIPYEPTDEPLRIEEMADCVTATFKEKTSEHGLGEPELWMEPGRYIVGEAGVLLTQVTGVKNTGKTFVGVDTGMHHMIRPMLLGAHHEIIVANDLDRGDISRKDIVGPICSSTDVLAADRAMPDVRNGDVLGIMNAGAYGFTMASNWNTRSLPAEVLVEDGEAVVIRERQEWDDMFAGTRLSAQ